MFYSIAIPDILSTVSERQRERTHAGMTKESTDSQSSSSEEHNSVNDGISSQASVEATPAPAPPVSTHPLKTGTTQQEISASPLTVTQLYEQLRRPIHSYIYRLLGSLEDADDITQEVFIRAYTAWDNLYERDNLSAWLYRIATNLCVDLLRRRKRISWQPLRRSHYNSDRFEDGVDEDAAFLASNSGGIPEIAERDHIRLALERLPEEYAVALILSAAQGIPYQEIAIIVGISPNAAATRISRAKRMFIEQYQRLNFEDAETQEHSR